MQNTKELFLKESVANGNINVNTVDSYHRIFEKVNDYEEIFGKDVAQFNFEELESVLYGFNAKNKSTIETYGRIISSYLNWACDKGLCKENLLGRLKTDDFNKYVINHEEYITEKQLRRYEDLCENYQDAVILRLLFIGVGGKGLSELRNLKKTDIDRENKCIYINKTDNKGNVIYRKTIKIDERTLYLLDGAINEKIYKKRNGNIIYNEHVREYTDLIDNDYVIRPSITKTDTANNPVDKFVIYRRLKNLSEFFGIDLNAKLIQKSGMLYYLHRIIKDNEVTLNDIKTVSEIFGIKSYHNLKSFLTTENVNKLYGKKEGANE